MTTQSGISRLFVAAILLTIGACTSMPASEKTCATGRGGGSDGFVPALAEGLRILLPENSTLVAENTYDSKHWAWDTAAGRVSVSWISSIARESLLKASRANSCVLRADEVAFHVSADGTRLTAISAPIYESGASLLVSIDGGRDLRSRDSGYRIIESIRITPE